MEEETCVNQRKADIKLKLSGCPTKVAKRLNNKNAMECLPVECGNNDNICLIASNNLLESYSLFKIMVKIYHKKQNSTQLWPY